MALAVPTVIRAAQLQDPSVRYLWDDWKIERAEQPIDPALQAKLTAMSRRAVLAFIVATGEWIAHRFAQLEPDPGPQNYLESAWARAIDVTYGDKRWEQYGERWRGPVQGALSRALNRVETAIEQLYDEGVDPARDGALIANLARHVMTDPGPYEAWRDVVIARLLALYPRDKADELGDPVPRELVFEGGAYDPAQADALLNAFLSRLDHRSNAFLNEPASMQREGFRGTPYVYERDRDRELRRASAS
jgi:hypothetical protein